ncbi:MBL fold metallo-hydrolase [Acetatifactor muris]|uniref:ComEC family competence protein n=1 Tax=Acetatifactor muris TaxID=879566 RepID=A0A2K4ZAY9_9FIRM|nr:MBL fold metallo-hydrolase [Acetatifactor muris]MCI8798504.1 MBL fold metallo-hydrolase [Lachnospiraceae bacterium]MCR2046261.1 MBL fold metallo-hydrolase [Acetatifactor muris]SOY27632.1 ComEC family competence protein [Acetatifactor muris]
MQTTLYMLQEQSHTQMMSYVLQSMEGKLVVIDGGTAKDAGHLLDTLIRLGGPEPTVDLWLLTHPHSDHVNALLEIFSRPNPLKVKKIYSKFLSYEFYEKYDETGARGARVTSAFNEFKESHREICLPFETGQKFTVDSIEIKVLYVPDESITENTINNSSVVFRVDAEGQRILFIGDLGEEAGDRVLALVPHGELRADFVQMAHHGQSGVKKSFYEVVSPKACLWNTPQWLWDNQRRGEPYNSGPWKTVEVQGWMKELGVRHHFITKDREYVLPLPYPVG